MTRRHLAAAVTLTVTNTGAVDGAQVERELADPSRVRISKEQMERMGNFPLSHLANFGMNFDHDFADPVASAWRQQTSVG